MKKYEALGVFIFGIILMILIEFDRNDPLMADEFFDTANIKYLSPEPVAYVKDAYQKYLAEYDMLVYVSETDMDELNEYERRWVKWKIKKLKVDNKEILATSPK